MSTTTLEVQANFRAAVLAINALIAAGQHVQLVGNTLVARDDRTEGWLPQGPLTNVVTEPSETEQLEAALEAILKVRPTAAWAMFGACPGAFEMEAAIAKVALLYIQARG